MTVSADVGPLAGDLRLVLGQLIRRLRAEHRFPLAQGAVLGRLDREGPTSIGQLASVERVRPQSMAQTVSDLEAGAMVTRHDDPADGRRILIEITHAGRETLAELRRDRDGWLARTIEEQLSEREQLQLARALSLLQRLAAS